MIIKISQSSQKIYYNIGLCKTKLQITGPSPWPFLIASILLYWSSHIILFLNGFNDILFNDSFSGLVVGIILLLILLCGWFFELFLESFQGYQNAQIRRNIQFGFKLFLISEFMLFTSTFWAYLHSALAPTIWVGCTWPPIGLTIFNPFRLPLIMTLALIGSGISLTVAYIILLRDGNYLKCLKLLIYTISHGSLFIFFQIFEFFKRPLTFGDSVFGCSFYATTGLHAFHVIIGLIFLIVITLFICFRLYTQTRHLSFDLGIWYWHFVDIMWIIVFILCYVWCSGWFFGLTKMFLLRPYYLFFSFYAYWVLISLNCYEIEIIILINNMIFWVYYGKFIHRKKISRILIEDEREFYRILSLYI